MKTEEEIRKTIEEREAYLDGRDIETERSYSRGWIHALMWVLAESCEF